MNNDKWITRDKQEIPITSMTDSHLINSFNMKMRLLSQLKRESSNYYQDMGEGFDEYDFRNLPAFTSPQSNQIEITRVWLVKLLNEIMDRDLTVKISV